MLNTVGLYTLYLREIRRFLKVFMQTLFAPVITTLLFMAVFLLALGRDGFMVAGMPFASFLTPGLVMMALVQNAFANSSSSLIVSKVNGNIVDTLLPPLSAFELTAAYAFGAVTRGLLVGVAVLLAVAVFMPVTIASPGLALFYAFNGALMLGLIGILTGLWAQKFDQVATITNFIVTPLSFLSGTFYSIQALPSFWHDVALLNPFFYMIDGLRYALTGYSDGEPYLGVAVLLLVNIGLWTACHRAFASGWRLKS